MKIEQMQVTIGQVYEGYINEGETENGVIGFDDDLNIRPKYQRNYVYKDAKRDEVVRTVLKRFPLSVFYWVDLGEAYDDVDEPRYEVLDGQQRTISICDYIDGAFSVDGHYFHSLPMDMQEAILGYELFVYVCSGTDSEKLDWFRIINIAGVPLTDQELRNAVYSGPWVSDAKKHFSKSNGPAYQLAGDYLSGEANRQEYMETAIKWHMQVTGDASIEEYMSKRKDDHKATELWNYFRSAIDWAQAVFPHYRSQMKGLPWGEFYNAHGTENLDPEALEECINQLMADPDVTKKKGVYAYVLTGDERELNIRVFDERTKREAYEQQKGICPICEEHYEYSDMEGDHIIPWSKGGHTTPDNCRMLCADCNAKLSNKHAG